MTNIRTAVPLILTLTALVGLNACSGDDPTGTLPPDDQVALLNVSPAGGMTNVDPGSSVTIGFEHSMRDGSEAYCALHLGDLKNRAGQEASYDQPLRLCPQVLLHAHGYSVLTPGPFNDRSRKEKGPNHGGSGKPDTERAINLHN